MRYSWTFEEVDEKLHNIMIAIHQECMDALKDYDLPATDYVAGANIAAMTKVIKAMIAQGNY